jgi:hypothetical protein
MYRPKSECRPSRESWRFILDLDTCFVVYPSFSCQILCSRRKVGHDRFLPNRIHQLLTVTLSFNTAEASVREPDFDSGSEGQVS